MNTDSRKRAISAENFSRIQRLSEPLIDTLDSKLSEIIEFYESHHGIENHSKPSKKNDQSASERRFDPLNAPNLTHTKLVFAAIGGRHIRSPSWNSLFDRVVTIAARQIGDFEILQGMTLANMVEGRKTEEGYRYLEDVGISIQGQSANDAWRGTASLALQTGQKVEARFFWRQKKGAQHPGEGGYFLIEER